MSKIGNWFDTRITLPKSIGRSEDVLCSLIHALGFGISLGAVIPLASEAAGSRREFWAALIYGASICSMFVVSAIYHGLPASSAKRVLRFADHSFIYVLIAGTYTPYASLMGDSGRPLLITIWMLATFNVAFNILFWGRFEFFHFATYLCMGWLIVFFWKDLRAAVSLKQVYWMLTGGFFYTTGVFFYVKTSIPWAHLIWHFFVIAGAAGLHLGIALQ